MSSIGQIVDLPMKDIYADDDFNCRGAIAPMDVIDLAKDIAANSLRNPIIVQVINNRYRIVAGHRRHMAFKINKSETIPCIIRSYSDELSARSENLKENLIRKQLNMMQECKAISPFINAGWSDKAIADEFQQSQAWSNIRRLLLTLSPEIQMEAAAGYLTQDQVRIISGMPEGKRHDKVREIKEAKMRGERVKLDKPPRKKNALVRRERRKSEIEELTIKLGDLIGMGMTTRALAWAAGNISDLEFGNTVRQHCEKEGIPFFGLE